MSGLVYVLASLLALVYAVVAWKVYPHFISIKDRVVKSPVQLYWGRFAASWLVFAGVVIMIPLNWHEFDTRPQLSSDPTQGASAATVSKPRRTGCRPGLCYVPTRSRVRRHPRRIRHKSLRPKVVLSNRLKHPLLIVGT